MLYIIISDTEPFTLSWHSSIMVIISLPLRVANWPLTEPSCSSCLNMKTAMRGCKQLTRVDSRKQVTYVDNRKYLGIVKSYMQVLQQ